MNKEPIEIERKFLVKALPEKLGQYKSFEIAQGYLSLAPDGSEERIRRKGDTYYKTFKRGVGKVRTEIETKISKEEFDSLWSKTEGKRVQKTRYNIPAGKDLYELDVYKGNLLGLTTVDVEFNSEEEAGRFNPPDWFGEDVTEDIRYKNQTLATKGLPE